MAEVARLGIDIDASGVAAARSELAGFGQTASQVASEVAGAASRMEQATARAADMTLSRFNASLSHMDVAAQAAEQAAINSVKDRFARLQGNAGGVSLSNPKIVDIDAQNQAIAAFEQNARRIANAKLDQTLAAINKQASDAAVGLNRSASGADSFDASLKPINQSLNKLLPTLGLIGPVGGVAGNILLDLATGISAASGVVALATVGAFSFSNAMRQSTEESQGFSKAIASDDIKFFTDKLEHLREIQRDRNTDNIFQQAWKQINGLFGDSDRLLVDINGKMSDYQRAINSIQTKKLAEIGNELRNESEQLESLLREDPFRQIQNERAQAVSLLSRRLVDLGITGERAQQALRKLNDNFDLKGLLIEERATRQIDQQVGTLRLQAAAVGASAAQTAAFGLAQQLANIQMQYAGPLYNGLREKVTGAAIALFQLKRAQDLVTSGKAAVSQFQQNFGVQFDFDKNKSARDLAVNFATNFNAHKDNPQYGNALQTAFGSLITQLKDRGVNNASGLLTSVGLSESNLSRLKLGLKDVITGYTEVQQVAVKFNRNAFGGSTRSEELETVFLPNVRNVKRELDEMDQRQFNWGAGFEKEAQRAETAAGKIGQELENVNKKLSDIQISTLRELAINVDVTDALAEVGRLQARLDSIPPITRKQVVFEIYAQGSPQLPFSEYFDSYMPGKLASLDSLLKSSTPEIILQTNATSILRQIQDLDRASRESISAANFGHNPGQVSSEATRNTNLTNAQRTAQQRGDLENQLRLALAAAQSQAAGRGGGGASSGVTINMDLTGAVMGRDWLDAEMIPALERAILRTTGQEPGFRIQN